ncbi:hypothetical protein LCGC14_2043940 [marine sediment metagenome]|uniref:Uncharacterized protein n=1 Tax=marine sediment metagenome TaxID=412755 RepID=A0A0F9ER53_9ZZZZ
MVECKCISTDRAAEVQRWEQYFIVVPRIGECVIQKERHTLLRVEDIWHSLEGGEPVIEIWLKK